MDLGFEKIFSEYGPELLISEVSVFDNSPIEYTRRLSADMPQGPMYRSFENISKLLVMRNVDTQLTVEDNERIISSARAFSFRQGSLIGLRLIDAFLLPETQSYILETESLSFPLSREPVNVHDRRKLQSNVYLAGNEGYREGINYQPIIEKWEPHLALDYRLGNEIKCGFGFVYKCVIEAHKICFRQDLEIMRDQSEQEIDWNELLRSQSDD